MKKETKRALGKEGEKLVRTTLFFTKGLDRMLDLLAITEGKPKGLIIREVLTEHLRKRGLDPNKEIKDIKVSYE